MREEGGCVDGVVRRLVTLVTNDTLTGRAWKGVKSAGGEEDRVRMRLSRLSLTSVRRTLRNCGSAT
jgi:hypothetical protein